MQKAGKRELRKAKIKTSIYNELLKVSQRKIFQDIYVNDLCKKVKISKVTFFKYFPQKEELLQYYMRLWLIDLNIYLSSKRLEGLAAIHKIFERIGDQCLLRPNLVFAYITYVSNLHLIKKPYQISDAEKELIFGSEKISNDIQILSLELLFEKYVLEAIFNKEITNTTDTKEISLLLYSLFFGSIYTINLKSIKFVKHHLRSNLDHLIKGFA